MRFLRIAALAAAIIVAVGVAVWLLPLARFPERDAAAVPDGGVAVARREVDLAQAVTIELGRAPRSTAHAPSEGLVTTVEVAQGDPIECGAPLYSVRNQPVVAYCGTQPLWRDIAAETVGADADGARSFLVELGYLSATGAGAAAFEAAVEQFRADAGLEPGTVLPVANLIWVGDADEKSVDDVAIVAGARIARGADVLTTGGEIERAIVNGLPESHPPQDFVVSIGDRVLTIGDDSAIEDVAAIEEVVASTAAPPDGEQRSELQARARLAEAQQVWAVPATGIISGPKSTCVRLVDRDADASEDVVEVAVVDYSTGTAMVTGELAVGDVVDANPEVSAC